MPRCNPIIDILKYLDIIGDPPWLDEQVYFILPFSKINILPGEKKIHYHFDNLLRIYLFHYFHITF